MISDDYKLSEYGNNFLSILHLKDGIRRLTRLATYPNGELPDSLKSDFDALCEFVVFNECIRRPFFKILSERLYESLGNLYSVLATNESERFSALTYKEAFELFSFIGQRNVRSILDAYKKCTSSMYSGIIEAVGQQDYNAFKTALDDMDCQDMMVTLWKLRYVVWGNVPLEHGRHKNFDNNNQWIKGADFSKFFKSVNIHYEEDFTQNCVKRFFHIPLGLKRRGLGGDGVFDAEIDTPKLYSTTTIADGKFYPVWLDHFSNLCSDKFAFNRYLNKINNNADLIIEQGNELSYSIIGAVIHSHKAEIYEQLHIKPQAVTDEDEDCGDYDIIYDKGVLGDYIMVYTSIMLKILREVKDVLSDEDRNVLRWLLNLSRYTSFFMECTKDDTTKTEETPIAEKDDGDDEGNSEKLLEATPENVTKTSFPTDIYDRKRLRNESIINITCQVLQDWFVGANVGDIEFLFFGKGKSHQTKYTLKTTAKKLCEFVKYYIGTKNIKAETWAYFAERIYKNGKTVFLVPKQASGYAKPEEQDVFENNFRTIIRDKLKNGLTKEQENDIK